MLVENSLWTETTVLVPYKPCHVPTYHKWMDSIEIREQTASERLTFEQEWEMQAAWQRDPDKLTFIILDRLQYEASSRGTISDDEAEIMSMVGDVNIFLSQSADDDPHLVAELEIMIAKPEARRRGLALQSLIAIMQYAFVRLDITNPDSYQAKIRSTNFASLNLFENKLGFKRQSGPNFFDEITLQLDPHSKFWSDLMTSAEKMDIRLHSHVS